MHPGTILFSSSRYEQILRTVNDGQFWEATRFPRPRMPFDLTRFVLDPMRPGRVITALWYASAAEYEFAPDLAVTMAPLNSVLPVSALTPVRFTVRNHGPHAASPSDLQIGLPASVAVSWPQGCSLGMQVVYCRVPALQVHAEHEILLNFNPLNPTSGNITAALTTHETDPDASDNSSSFAVTAGEVTDIDLTLSATQTTVRRGAATELVATLVNHGPSAANSATLNFAGLQNFVVTSVTTSAGSCNANQTPTCSFGTLAPDATVTVRLDLQADTTGDFAIIAAANSAAPDSDGQQSSVYLPLLVQAVADVTVLISESMDPVAVDGPLRYTVDVRNPAGDPGATALVVDITGATISAAIPNTGTCTHTSTTVTCALVPTPAASVAIELGTAVAGIATATATVTYSGTDSNPANNTHMIGTSVRRTADLAVTVAPSVTTAALDTEFTFTATVRNDGPNAAPVALSFGLLNSQAVAASVTSGTCANTAITADCTLASLAPGASANFSLRARGTTPGSAQAIATVSSNAFDMDSADNQATSTAVALARMGDLSVSITDSEDPATAGPAFNYAVTIQNLGPNAGDVHLVVPVTGATVSAATPSAGTCAITATQVTCDLASLASGATATVRIDVSAASAGTAQAVPAVTFSGTDPVTTNDTATASTVVTAAPSSSSSSSSSSSGGGGSGGGGGGGRFDWLALVLLGAFAWRRLAVGR